MYQVTCRNLDEAHYLLAIINSHTLENAVRDYMPKGLFGARDLEKHLWKLPIPEYDSNNGRHAELSRLGRTAAQECKQLLVQLVLLNGEDWLTVERARSNLRVGWQPGSSTAQAIESAVGALLASG